MQSYPIVPLEAIDLIQYWCGRNGITEQERYLAA